MIKTNINNKREEIQKLVENYIKEPNLPPIIKDLPFNLQGHIWAIKFKYNTLTSKLKPKISDIATMRSYNVLSLFTFQRKINLWFVNNIQKLITFVLKRKMDPNIKGDNHGYTLLHIICIMYDKKYNNNSRHEIPYNQNRNKTRTKSKDMFQTYLNALLTAGANLDIKEKNNEDTPLHIACRDKSIKPIELLLEKGADPNIKNKDGDTPLHIACRNNFQSIHIELLLGKGADPNIKNKAEDTPLDVVCKSLNNPSSVIRLLIIYGARHTSCPKEKYQHIIKQINTNVHSKQLNELKSLNLSKEILNALEIWKNNNKNSNLKNIPKNKYRILQREERNIIENLIKQMNLSKK